MKYRIKSLKRKKLSYKTRGGNKDTDIPLCIYSHSDVFHVLEIQFEYLTKVFKNTSQKIYLFANKNYDKKSELTYETILYDDNIPYNKRILYCINRINCNYFIISHENDILLSYSNDIIKKLADTMKTNKIDSIDLKQHEMSIKPIQVTDNISITNINNHKYVFNVQPRLWKYSSAVSFFSSTPDKTYKSSENANIQNYLKTQQITYGMFSKNIIRSTCDFNVLPEYKYMHITRDGKFINPNTELIDASVKEEYVNIYNKYIKDSKR